MNRRGRKSLTDTRIIPRECPLSVHPTPNRCVDVCCRFRTAHFGAPGPTMPYDGTISGSRHPRRGSHVTECPRPKRSRSKSGKNTSALRPRTGANTGRPPAPPLDRLDEPNDRAPRLSRQPALCRRLSVSRTAAWNLDAASKLLGSALFLFRPAPLHRFGELLPPGSSVPATALGLRGQTSIPIRAALSPASFHRL